MKAILMSIHPKWCELIAAGKKTVEVRKTAPKDTPFKVYMYMTHKGNKFIQKMKTTKGYDAYVEVNYKITGKVVGEYVCKKVEECVPDYNPITQEFFYNDWEDCSADSLTSEEETAYGKGKPLYGLHISELKIYDKPKELGEFKTIKCTNKRGSCSDCKTKPDCIKQITRPPQGWQYVEDIGQ